MPALEDYLQFAAPAGTIASGLGGILDSSQLKNLGLDFGGISGLYSLGTGIAGDDPKRAVSGLADIAKMLSQVPGIEGLASTVPYIGSLLSLFKLGQTVAGGNPATILASLPSLAGTAGSIAGIGALGSTLAAAAPALGTIGAFAIPAAAAAFFATNTMRKDAERVRGQIHEWNTARRDLPVTMRQMSDALSAHQQMGDDLSQLSNEELRNLTNATQTGMLAQVPGGHALMQLGAGEDFAGIKPVDVSKPQALAQMATITMGRDYMRQADEFAKRGLTLGGDAKTAMHGSMYDPPEQQQALNAPNAADMLKQWATQFDPYSAEARQVNRLLDASREYTFDPTTGGGGAIEKLDIPNFTPGNYEKAFDAYTSGLMNIVPQPKQQDQWVGGVYRGPNPNEYVPYSPNIM